MILTHKSDPCLSSICSFYMCLGLHSLNLCSGFYLLQYDFIRPTVINDTHSHICMYTYACIYTGAHAHRHTHMFVLIMKYPFPPVPTINTTLPTKNKRTCHLEILVSRYHQTDESSKTSSNNKNNMQNCGFEILKIYSLKYCSRLTTRVQVSFPRSGLILFS